MGSTRTTRLKARRMDGQDSSSAEAGSSNGASGEKRHAPKHKGLQKSCGKRACCNPFSVSPKVQHRIRKTTMSYEEMIPLTRPCRCGGGTVIIHWEMDDWNRTRHSIETRCPRCAAENAIVYEK